MISVVIVANREAESLAAMLSQLVEGVVEGPLKDVVVVAAHAAQDCLALAHHAGATVVACDEPLGAQLRAGCMAARADTIMAIDGTWCAAPDWRRRLLRHDSRHIGGWTRPLPLWQRIVRQPAHAGLVAPKQTLLAIGNQAATWAACCKTLPGPIRPL